MSKPCNLLRAHATFKRKYNKLDTNNKRDLPGALIDDILYEAARKWYEEVYSGNSLRPRIKNGFEVTQQKTDMLSYYLKSEVLSIDSTDNCGKYILTLPSDYRHHIRTSFKDLECDSCLPFNVDITDHNNLTLSLRDKNQKPSRTWGRALGTFRECELELYTDPNTVPSEITIEYLRCIKRPFIGKYDSLEYIAGDTNSPSKTTTPTFEFDIPEKYCEWIVDYAVQEIAETLYDQFLYQTKDANIIKTIS